MKSFSLSIFFFSPSGIRKTGNRETREVEKEGSLKSISLKKLQSQITQHFIV